jgi:cytochrome c oxidase cbb3-type subunit III
VSRVLCLIVSAFAASCLVSGCEREARRFMTPAGNTTPAETGQRMSPNQPGTTLAGGVKQAVRNTSPYEGNAFAVNQGKRLYRWYNCNGCHANGGGSMGPALMDSEWRYGSDPESLFRTIMQGRPNGMPSFGGHIPEDQVWKIVAYVRAMGGGVRTDVAPSRTDSLYPGKPENFRSPQPAIQKGDSRAEQSLEVR